LLVVVEVGGYRVRARVRARPAIVGVALDVDAPVCPGAKGELAGALAGDAGARTRDVVEPFEAGLSARTLVSTLAAVRSVNREVYLAAVVERAVAVLPEIGGSVAFEHGAFPRGATVEHVPWRVGCVRRLVLEAAVSAGSAVVVVGCEVRALALA